MEYSPIVFLLGAGASRDAGVPDFAAYWKMFAERFQINVAIPPSPEILLTGPWNALRAEVQYLRESRPGIFTDFESLCRRLRELQVANIVETKEHRSEKHISESHLLLARELALAEFAIRKDFLTSIDTDFACWFKHPDNLAKFEPYRRLFDYTYGDPPLDIFSLNNDILIEWLGMQFGVQVNDGFAPNGEVSQHWAEFEKCRNGVRLYKMHGSLNWKAPAFASTVAQVQSRRTLKGISQRGHIASHVADTPLIWSGVYDAFENQLGELRTRFFAQAVCNALVVVIAGYKLADPKVSQTFFDGLTGGRVRMVYVILGSLPDRDHVYFPQGILALEKRFGNRVRVMDGKYFPKVLGESDFIQDLRRHLA